VPLFSRSYFLFWLSKRAFPFGVARISIHFSVRMLMSEACSPADCVFAIKMDQSLPRKRITDIRLYFQNAYALQIKHSPHVDDSHYYMLRFRSIYVVYTGMAKWRKKASLAMLLMYAM